MSSGTWETTRSWHAEPGFVIAIMSPPKSTGRTPVAPTVRRVAWLGSSSSSQDDNRRAPANTPGIRHIAFAVEGIDAAVADLRARCTELVGELERYEDSYRLCYVRGPEGIIVELAEQIS
jgi:catechol 2,3-dioxygenase-like lactoylglutathione lyase family enzyme